MEYKLKPDAKVFISGKEEAPDDIVEEVDAEDDVQKKDKKTPKSNPKARDNTEYTIDSPSENSKFEFRQFQLGGAKKAGGAI